MTDHTELRDQLVSTRVRRLEGGEPPYRDPTLRRLRRGYFHPGGTTISVAEQHRLRVLATMDARPSGVIFSHASAAELWDCPLLAADLREVHVTQPGRARRTTAGVRVHRAAIPEEHILTRDDGLMMTSREWTAAQVAATGALPGVLLPLDALVRDIAREQECSADDAVATIIGLLPPRMKGGARARRHLQLTDPRSGSAGESLSRGQMWLLGVPMPDLQVGFPRGELPGEDIVDFDWPELGVFGEFDGEAKYVERQYTDGRDPAEVLWDEKRREDRIRRHRPRAARWGWAEAMSRTRLARALAAAGIVPAPR